MKTTKRTKERALVDLPRAEIVARPEMEMTIRYRRRPTVRTILFVAMAPLAIVVIPAGDLTVPLAAYEQANLEDFTKTTLAELGIKAVEPGKDAKTGFSTGGKNATALIEKLPEINGRTIAELERNMRPGAAGVGGSDNGFLGTDEKLLEVLADDNKLVVDKLGLTHQTLALHLRSAAAIGEKTKGMPFVYHGRRFKVTVRYSRGFQLSPFQDDTKTNADATVENLDNGKNLEFSLLVPQMIERYGFYEGKGTSYRVDPAQIVEVFDFLKKEKSPTRVAPAFQ
jgi:hypothetical protein